MPRGVTEATGLRQIIDLRLAHTFAGLKGHALDTGGDGDALRGV